MYKGKNLLILSSFLWLNISSFASARPINPSPQASASESELDRHFRVAFHAATGGDFDTAIINYRRAADDATDHCDRQHAEAGVQAATEAKDERTAGRTDLLTQIFARRLEALALPLPCTTVQ
jgi:hypothetical protein